MKSLIPTSAKAEWHLTYGCSLRCRGCSRASWLAEPHTADMTLDDADEWCSQAAALGWTQQRPHGERPRIVIIGGEPTLHPQFLSFVRMAVALTGNVQVFSNCFTQYTLDMLRSAQALGASVCRDGAKTRSVEKESDYRGWRMTGYVSPQDAGLPPSPPCYQHSSEICGLCVDHAGYSMCPIGGTMRALLGIPRTRVFAALFDEATAARLTAEECLHCGFEYCARPVSNDDRDVFLAYAATLPRVHGVPMSPTWQRVFAERAEKQA